MAASGDRRRWGCPEQTRQSPDESKKRTACIVQTVLFALCLRQYLVHFGGIRLFGTVDDRDDPHPQYLGSESNFQYIAHLDIIGSFGGAAVDGDMGVIARLVGHRSSLDDTGYLQILV